MSKKNQKKVVLAYSGGLDTSVILKWLVNKGYEVICYVGKIGQEEDYKEIEKKAMATGASKIYIEDLREEFVTDFIYPALKANTLYEGRYLLGTSLARPVLAKKQIEIAQKENAAFVSHGATGKGNDQVRFELTCYALDPEIQVIAPWRDTEFLEKFKGRSDLIAYAKEQDIPVKATLKKPYSEDENLLHISHEAGILEDPNFRPSEDVFSLTKSPQDAPDKETIVEIHFEKGIPVELKNVTTGESFTDPLELFLAANKLGSENAIGRLDMVENRFIGIKSRGVYETPGATILLEAHKDLEGLTMDKEVMHIRDMLMPKFAEVIYNGFWYSPEMNMLQSAIDTSQENVNGYATLALYKGNVLSVGRYSDNALYDEDFSSMDKEGGFDATDSTGFINVQAIRLKANSLLKKKKK